MNKLKLMGKKRGMTQLFDEQGNIVVCTVIEVQSNVVTQIKTTETDGYNSVQLGFDEIIADDPRTAEKRAGKPLAGHFKKAGVTPRRFLKESRLESVEGYAVGQEVGLEAFAGIEYIDATARSKGKGYQGVMKLHNFSGGPASHGSGFHRHMGSTGMRSTPGRCLPGGKRASHMGDDQVTVQNLKVVKIDEQAGVLVVKGQVPGPKNGFVLLAPAVKLHTSQTSK